MTTEPTPETTKKLGIVTRRDNWLDSRTGIDSILHESLD